jgi:hypothetical protein
MKRILNFLIGAELTASQFKRIEGGWVFKTPAFRRLFGLAPYYRVNDEMKAAIEHLYMRMWRGGMLAIIPLVIGALIVKEMFSATIAYELAFGAGAGTLLGLGMVLGYTRALKRVLRDAVAIVEKFTWADQQRAVMEALTIWRTAAYLGISSLLGCAVFLSARSGDLAAPLAVAGLVLFGLSTLYYSIVLIWKMRTQPHRQNS